MKLVSALLLSVLASATAFAPSQQSPRTSVAVDALADKIFGLDLFEPVKDQNNYGARAKKNLKVGSITSKSYIPDGLTEAQYKKLRAQEQKKKQDNYTRNVKKAGVFEDFTEFYKKRGTEEGGSWLKSAALGHRMAKTKYDWGDGVEADSKKFESTKFTGIFGGFKAPTAKKTVAKKAPAKKKSYF